MVLCTILKLQQKLLRKAVQKKTGVLSIKLGPKYNWAMAKPLFCKESAGTKPVRYYETVWSHQGDHLYELLRHHQKSSTDGHQLLLQTDKWKYLSTSSAFNHYHQCNVIIIIIMIVISIIVNTIRSLTLYCDECFWVPQTE